MLQDHVEAHVDLIAQHEQAFRAQRTRSERIGDQIAVSVGSFAFVCGHLLFFAAWAGWNVLPRVRHFDPLPFSLLGTLLALEAILLASFILMRQARMSRRAEERDHLMLQILILTEKEITTLLRVERQIAHQVGADKAANASDVHEFSKQTSIDDVAQTIKENLDADLEEEP